ncbi:MAG TPA: Crp/Fnr family transcriptional regulator [Fimbriimonadaceae bacterium]|nr:Crp/Fnr family transcriptional regulator [Fimbriimonadaceae bacterium]
MHSVPDPPSNRATIEACTLLNALEPSERMRLASECFSAFAEKGESIWFAGAPADFAAVVGTGFVKMTKLCPNGQEVALELLGPGQCFGVMAAIEGRPVPLSAYAVTNCWYLKVPTNCLLALYHRSEALKDRIVRTIGPRLRKAHDMISRLSSGRVEERLAAVLFILADSFGTQDNQGLHLQVPLTRQDLAEMAGTTVETTIRIMSRWQKEGLVCTEHQAITIIDPESLSKSVHR